jgi:hypothetical protein
MAHVRPQIDELATRRVRPYAEVVPSDEDVHSRATQVEPIRAKAIAAMMNLEEELASPRSQKSTMRRRQWMKAVLPADNPFLTPLEGPSPFDAPPAAPRGARRAVELALLAGAVMVATGPLLYLLVY